MTRLDDVLNELEEFLEDQQDVVDGSYGEPHPNRAMSLLTWLRQERKAPRPEVAEQVGKDAARYRWWRDNFGVEYDGPDSMKLYTLINSRFRRGLSEPQGFDAAIDGAMSASLPQNRSASDAANTLDDISRYEPTRQPCPGGSWDDYAEGMGDDNRHIGTFCSKCGKEYANHSFAAPQPHREEKA